MAPASSSSSSTTAGRGQLEEMMWNASKCESGGDANNCGRPFSLTYYRRDAYSFLLCNEGAAHNSILKTVEQGECLEVCHSMKSSFLLIQFFIDSFEALMRELATRKTIFLFGRGNARKLLDNTRECSWTLTASRVGWKNKWNSHNSSLEKHCFSDQLYTKPVSIHVSHDTFILNVLLLNWKMTTDNAWRTNKALNAVCVVTFRNDIVVSHIQCHELHEESFSTRECWNQNITRTRWINLYIWYVHRSCDPDWLSKKGHIPWVVRCASTSFHAGHSEEYAGESLRWAPHFAGLDDITVTRRGAGILGSVKTQEWKALKEVERREKLPQTPRFETFKRLNESSKNNACRKL